MKTLSQKQGGRVIFGTFATLENVFLLQDVLQLLVLPYSKSTSVQTTLPSPGTRRKKHRGASSPLGFSSLPVATSSLGRGEGRGARIVFQASPHLLPQKANWQGISALSLG